jgi:redox-sensitive bicupin YhaK (pirin superfamily)
VVPLDATFEHVLCVLDGTLLVGERPVGRGQSAYVGAGRDELALTAPDGARVLLLGGEPFDEPLLMWWNFVGRTREEIALARQQWESGDERFGRVATSLARVPSPATPWARAG